MVYPFHWELCKGAHGIRYKFIHTLNIHVNTYTFSLSTRVSMETDSRLIHVQMGKKGVQPTKLDMLRVCPATNRLG
jgi:hypothetical protein